jgi:hypothetical protein
VHRHAGGSLAHHHDHSGRVVLDSQPPPDDGQDDDQHPFAGDDVSRAKKGASSEFSRLARARRTAVKVRKHEVVERELAQREQRAATLRDLEYRAIHEPNGAARAFWQSELRKVKSGIG